MFTWLPMGYGKSLCYQLLSFLFDFKLGRTGAIATERSVALVISLVVSLIVDRICSLQARSVCAAIVSGNTGISKALLANKRDISLGKLRFLFIAPEAIVGNSRWKQMLLELPLCHQIVAVRVGEDECIQMCPHTLSTHSLRERLHLSIVRKINGI